MVARLLSDLPKPTTIKQALRNGLGFFSKLQTADGHWAGDYGGPMFLLPGYAIVMYITKQPIEDEARAEIIRYLSNLQNPDGGWGIHIESESTVFGTSLNYCAMRILGVDRADDRLCRARVWLAEREGCLRVPSWGKFWLAVLNVYSWEGVNSLFPEMVLLPQWFPLHTQRMWCYARTVYMPMSWLYGKKYQCPVDSLIHELRSELLPKPFDEINWASYRNEVASEDLYTPHTRVLDAFYAAVNVYEKFAPAFLRRWALDWIYEVLEKENEFTNNICIGPINKMTNMLIVWIQEGPESTAFRKHAERVKDYMWLGRDGMKMNGTNGSQLWDTAFMVQGMIETDLRDEFKDVFRKAHDYIDVAQIQHNHPEHRRYYRDETKGGWPFSTRAMGWIVADCTGEGLKGALICKRNNYTPTPLSDSRLFDAVEILLKMQNSTGGYATCEKTRGSHLFEWFNASEVFGEIMIDYDYVECTSSALQGLCQFRDMYPDHRRKEVDAAITRAINYLFRMQRADGSFEGMWGICFTYGTWFALDGLGAAGYDCTDPRIMKACDFLASKQKPDGGWGETFLSCVHREYSQHPKSQVVNTAWAVLGLLKPFC
ncbi:cycloartenol synthase [Salpingoeca rosetta]|uniref:Cycloartenol synthase n=1 Tax=Salpingoeca rosetta (strain ATCC 50818 / BSB-021) TaxID=946362 RepID=F2USM8_SALR5|nr:cycloartenol synthase [Salpingoeca rosetta]EGD81137.1 cycloartenol synthase [Salpingoeca rosetta]|eukprot:XP_004987822.1 cycloartenol synthase [Salpingoeca rosetta]